MKTGMNHQGQEILGIEYLHQRIQDAFITPRGSIPLSRGYGSNLNKLLDSNVDADFTILAYELIVDAFTNTENDLDDCIFKSMTLQSENDHVTFTVNIEYDGEEVKLEGLNYG